MKLVNWIEIGLLVLMVSMLPAYYWLECRRMRREAVRRFDALVEEIMRPRR